MKREKKNNFVILLFELLVVLLTHSEDHNQYIGDIEEMYSIRLKQQGATKANIFLLSQIFRSIPAYISTSIFWGASMFRNYFKITIRSIIHAKVFSFINITGIAISIAVCFLILQYVGFEESYDTFHKNIDNLYRITNDRFQDSKLIQHGVITYPSVAKQMQIDYPEVKNFTRLLNYNEFIVKHNENTFSENVLFADSAFFDMFSFRLLQGDRKNLLTAPFSIVISESQAVKYFGSGWRKEEIIGKTLLFDNETQATIKGVFEDVPANSHMEFNTVMSWSSLVSWIGPHWDDSWTNSNMMCYAQLLPGTNAGQLAEKVTKDFDENYFNGNEVTGYFEKFYFQPLSDIHLHSDYEYETWVHGSATTVSALLIIAGFILLITWVNSINLATARSMERAKEVGLRKVVGAQRTNIIRQFLLESLLLNLIGITIAAIIVVVFEPYFREILSVNFSSEVFSSSLGIVFILIFILGTFFSGLYPAIVTSSFKITSVMKGKITRVGYGRHIRTGLVVFQFALSFILIAGTYAVYEQINFMMNKDLGMNINQVLVVTGPFQTDFDSTFIDKSINFKTELKRIPQIVDAASSRRLPGMRPGRIFNVQNKTINPEERYTTSDIGIDSDYFRTFDMEIIAGREFNSSDHNSNFQLVDKTVINETAVSLLGFKGKEDAVGKEINFWDRDWRIVGVVEDHHQQSLHVPVEPIIFTPQYSTGSWYFIRLNVQDISETISKIDKMYGSFFPDNMFKYYFLDEYFDTQYQNDKNFRTFFTIFTSLGLLLACMGLFGLSFFTIAQRKKEVGIRKVSGASTQSILGLFLKDFTKLVLIAVVVASPLTYFAISNWLMGYAYRIDFGTSMLILPALATLLVAIITVSYQTIKAALMNPIDPLKTE